MQPQDSLTPEDRQGPSPSQLTQEPANPKVRYDEPAVVSWTASEFIVNQKNAGWYMILAAAAVVIGGLVYLLTKDIISVTMVFAALAVIAILASKKPRTLSYRLDSRGLYIGQKAYPYSDFKSFSVIEEGAVSSIVLEPLRRFLPPINLYFDPKDEERITALLGDFLPYVEGHLDIVERLMRQIRL